MLQIAFVVGKSADVLRQKVHSCPWLREGLQLLKVLPRDPANADGYVNDDGTVPSDVGVAAYIAQHYGAEVTLLEGTKVIQLGVQGLNKFDVIYVIYDAIEIFHSACSKTTCPRERETFEAILQKTKARVWPEPGFHRMIIDKPQYYRKLEKAGLPVAPFFGITPTAALRDISGLAKRIVNFPPQSPTTTKAAKHACLTRCAKHPPNRAGSCKRGCHKRHRPSTWPGVILKPSYAGYSIGIQTIRQKHRLEARLKKYFTNMKQLAFPNVTVQEFVPSFGQHLEVRTYWIRGKFAYSVGTQTKKVTSGLAGSLPVDKFGQPSKKTLDHLKKIARKALRHLPRTEPMVRIDFGCCRHGKEWFINEVETLAANLLAEHTRFDVAKGLGAALYRHAKEA